MELSPHKARTKAALAAAKRRGKKLGGDRGARLSAKARAAGRAVVTDHANARARDLAPTIAEIQASGAKTLRAIADVLNAMKIPTARGAGEPGRSIRITGGIQGFGAS